jgi:glycosyltransferase involved in cell wall biosynthesis
MRPSRPNRILVLFGNVPLLGQELGNIEVMSAMRDQGNEVLFLIRQEWTRDTIQAELNRRGLPWEAVPFFDAIRRGHGPMVWLRNLRGLLLGSLRFLVISCRFGATHVHAANVEQVLNFLPGLMVSRLPLVFRAGDAPTRHHWLWRLVWRFLARRVSRFASISRYVDRTLLEAGVPPEKILPVGNVAPRKELDPDDPAPPLLALEPELCTFLFVGQITRQKGVDILVEAAIQRCLASSGCRFLIAGDFSWNNPLGQALLQRIQEHGLQGRIRMLGYVKPVGSLLGISDVHVCPSVGSEAYGHVVVEAKLMSRPSIIFPTGGLVELVRHGVDGWVCPEASVEALAQAFRAYEEDPGLARRQGAAGHASLSRIQGEGSLGEQWRGIYSAALREA